MTANRPRLDTDLANLPGDVATVAQAMRAAGRDVHVFATARAVEIRHPHNMDCGPQDATKAVGFQECQRRPGTWTWPPCGCTTHTGIVLEETDTMFQLRAAPFRLIGARCYLGRLVRVSIRVNVVGAGEATAERVQLAFREATLSAGEPNERLQLGTIADMPGEYDAPDQAYRLYFQSPIMGWPVDLTLRHVSVPRDPRDAPSPYGTHLQIATSFGLDQ